MSSTFSHRDDLIDRVLAEPKRASKFYLDSGWPRDIFEVMLAMAMALTRRGFRPREEFFHLAFPHFVERVERLIDRGLRFRLLAGERSRAAWHLPASVVRRAGGVHVMPGVGHLMILERPDDHFAWIARLVERD